MFLHYLSRYGKVGESSACAGFLVNPTCPECRVCLERNGKEAWKSRFGVKLSNIESENESPDFLWQVVELSGWGNVTKGPRRSEKYPRKSKGLVEQGSNWPMKDEGAVTQICVMT